MMQHATCNMQHGIIAFGTVSSHFAYPILPTPATKRSMR